MKNEKGKRKEKTKIENGNGGLRTGIESKDGG